MENEERINANLPFIMTTTESITGCEIVSYKGLTNGDIILGTGFMSEFGAKISDFFGSQAIEFEAKLRTAKERAYTEMQKQAVERKANSIIGIKFSVSTIGNK